MQDFDVQDQVEDIPVEQGQLGLAQCERLLLILGFHDGHIPDTKQMVAGHLDVDGLSNRNSVEVTSVVVASVLVASVECSDIVVSDAGVLDVVKLLDVIVVNVEVSGGEILTTLLSPLLVKMLLITLKEVS